RSMATADVAPTRGVRASTRQSLTILDQIPIHVNDHCVGVGWDGERLWVSAGDATTGQCEWYIYDEYGTLLANMPQDAGATGWGHRDLAYNGSYMFGSYSHTVNGFEDPATYSGSFNGCLSPNRAMAWDGQHFYTCGFGEYLTQVEWDGEWDSTAACTPLSGPWQGACGLAYDHQLQGLWMTTADYSGNLYSIIETYTTLPDSIAGGCTMACTEEHGYVLVVLMQRSTDTLVFYDVEHSECPELHVCCVDDACQVMFEQECTDAGGEFHSDWDSCYPNPCEPCVVRPDGLGGPPTIQSAIDAALPGMVIELTDGIYRGDGNRDLEYRGKAITVRSQSGNPHSCVIDCQGSETEPHRGFSLHSGEGAGSVLEGVTITNAYTSDRGGGIFCHDASPTISGCIISNCEAGEEGAGILCRGSSPTLTDCIFRDNTAGVRGGGISAYEDSECTLESCEFYDNSASSWGGGIFHSHGTLNLSYCTFAGNGIADSTGGGGLWCEGSTNEFENCTLSDNSGDAIVLDECTTTLSNTIIAFTTWGEAVYCIGLDNTLSVECCDVYENDMDPGCLAGQIRENGNINLDPLFCDRLNRDFRLNRYSPCLPSYNPDCGLIGAWAIGCPFHDVPQAPTGASLGLAPGSPNPFEVSTQIHYRVPGEGSAPVVLNVYDVSGRLIRTLVDSPQPAGSYSVPWDGTDQMGHPMHDGIYLYQLRVGEEKLAKRVVLVR
ncbi:right-handed parallel beta-helix repeat-containing protein, partial [Candidatus Eisenbacteria bacterium]